MTINTNFNVNPYYDDFDEAKKHLRILFKPGYAVQSRELTQLQTLLQNQTSRFGKHVFRNGTKVSDAAHVQQTATYINLSSTYASTDIIANNFVGQTIFSTDGTKRATVLKVYDADSGTGEPITLMVKQVYGDAFISGETIKTNETSPYFATTSGIGTGQIFSVDTGIWFYEGFFIQNSQQTIAVSKYTTNSNTKVGFEITESISKPTEDTSLLDPALDASNYQAPGADRFVIDLVLSKRSLDSTDTTQFIELGRFIEGSYTSFNDTPQYAVLADEFARRTYDESGNYTVNPFKISLADNSSNTAQTTVTLSPGKGYVYGYEIESKFPTPINVDKPRDTVSVNNKRVSADFGEYIYTKNHFGTLPIDSLTTIDVHCVSSANVNTTSTATISNTKIGTIRVKSYDYDDASNTSNSKTYSYRTSIFDVNVLNSITGNVNTATATTVSIGNTTAGQIFSSITDAYAGAKFRITTETGSDEAPKTITSFNASTQTLTFAAVDSFVSIPTSASKFSIDFEFKDAESLLVNSSTTIVSSADIDLRSKDPASTYNDSFISDSSLEPLIFKFGEDWIANNSISDLSFYYKKLYTGVSFSSNAATISVTDAARETFVTASSSLLELANYQIVCTSGSGKHTTGQTVTSANLSVSLSGGDTSATLTVTDSNSMTANVLATIYVPNPVIKSKTYVTCNPCVQTSANGSGSGASGNQTANVNSGAALVYGTQGQTTIAASAVVKTPGTAQSLYVTDVTQIVQILDFNGSAVANTGGTDVTSKYSFNNGQKDSYYDHAFITLKSGYTAPNGPLVVRYNRYTSSGSGFFTNASYIPNYDIIPSYTSQTNNTYNLRDCLDFRPVRADASGAYTSGTVSFDLTSLTGPKIPVMGSAINADYSYYLPRFDRVVLHKNRVFEVVKGNSSLYPVEPQNPSDAMTLYVLHNPPYVANSANINVQYIENKRYTMRDIGTIEKRVENLEYYTSLSLIEQDTLNKQDLTILDSTNLPRFKNGIITDSFKGHSVADITNNDYKVSIDINKQEMRPTFNITSCGLTFDSANSINHSQTGPFVTISSNSVTFIDQPLASEAIDVNPFNVLKYMGKITLSPPSDIWIDTTKKADLLVDLSGDKDAWKMITDKLPVTYQWGSWNDIYFGKKQTNVSGWSQGWITYETTSTVQSVTQQKQGIMTAVVPETITQSLGDRVIDVSVIPYMRAQTIKFYATNLRPQTLLYPFFDNQIAEKYTARANRFLLDKGGLLFHCGLGTPEKINVANSITNSVINVVKTAQNSGNSVFTLNIVDVPSASFVGNTKIVGQESGLTANVIGYLHYSGNVVSATSNTIILSKDASGANNEGWYANTSNSNTIFIVAGTGAGQQATITGYNATTRNVSISGTWTTTPDTSSVYSIGRLTTTGNGDVSGIFYLRNGIHKIGEKVFQLVDNSTNDLPTCSTSGECSYFAQGLLQTTQSTTLSTIAPKIERFNVTDTQIVLRTLSSSTVAYDNTPSGGGGCDPLSETFTVSPKTYPNGIVLDKVRVCFATKDEELPVILEIRPSVNGYPSADTTFPFASVTLSPDKVKTIGIDGIPDLDDSSKYTEFVLDAPLYLKPGEHSFVILSPSNQYKVFSARTGAVNIADAQQISKQPYSGSLFKSQNASTWTAEQDQDLMFRIYRKSFDVNNSAYAYFNVDVPASNTPFDVVHLSTAEIVVANTRLSYDFQSETSTGGYAGYKNITPLDDYDCNDGANRRVLNPTTGAKTFTVRATMGTTDEAVSPVLDIFRFGILAVENIINNMPLLNTGFVITSSGSGYAANASVTISGGNGSGANAYAVANVTTGTITNIIVDNPGSGYTTSPTITLSGNATATYNGEDAKTGGNSYSRYIIRKVTLADGFDSGDLRVYVTAYKPSGSNVLVYYKMLSKSDSDTFDNKSWQLMTQLGNENFVSSSSNDYRELVFAPGINGTANNSVYYTSNGSAFTSFKTFAIKIVLSGTSTVDVPKVRDFRSIALPAGA